jgi:hypothetical protein
VFVAAALVAPPSEGVEGMECNIGDKVRMGVCVSTAAEHLRKLKCHCVISSAPDFGTGPQ